MNMGARGFTNRLLAVVFYRRSGSPAESEVVRNKGGISESWSEETSARLSPVQ